MDACFEEQERQNYGDMFPVEGYRAEERSQGVAAGSEEAMSDHIEVRSIMAMVWYVNCGTSRLILGRRFRRIPVIIRLSHWLRGTGDHFRIIDQLGYLAAGRA